MNVFVTGPTGVLGSRLVERLATRGHDVYGLVRDEAGAQLVERRGGVARRGDVLEPETLADATADIDVDVVVHAATAIPTADKPTAEDWERNDRVRVEGAKNILAATDDIEQVVFPGVVWVARQPDGSAFDEESPVHPTRSTQSALDVEQYFEREGEKRGFDVSILRLGFLYAPDAEHTRSFAESLLSRDLPILGGGLLGRQDAEISWLHADDAADALAEVVDSGTAGLWHVVDDEPTTAATFLQTFAELLDAPSPRRIPGWLAKPLAGSDTVRFMTNPMPTSNERFSQQFDWEPTHATCQEGLEQVLETWEAEGRIRRTESGYEWDDSSERPSQTDGSSARQATPDVNSAS